MANEYEMIVASHTIAELYAVLGTLPLKPRITSLIARNLITENIEPNREVILLSPGEYKSVIKQISQRLCQKNISANGLEPA